MFSKILIANRGEIACRVIKTARRMGIKTVAVYSDADARAPHVLMADESVRLGPPPAAESYLKADLIIEACRATGAEAVHPGYGFLSERESFARALDEAGIAFIGPPPNAIAAMGDKIESKKLAKEAGVNVVPGYLGEIADTDAAVKIANDIGYPVMMKASAGGGGKGMRLAYSEQDVREGFEATKREGLASFGDDRVFIEKFILSPRHIEIQVLGDKHGNIVYLGERECSIQRRHQKVVEEAPSPFVTPAMRKAMGEQAVALARAVGYYSAGTVELIVSGADTTGESFYFLEMNTRLQVEHPVTEMVTGLDLVAWQLRVAAGETLPEQAEIAFRGHAIEVRLYAEDPRRGYLPQTGRVLAWEPASGEGVRVDHGVGASVSPHYDPMIAKVIAHGASRDEARRRLVAALRDTVVFGVVTNAPFLVAALEDEAFARGEATTAFLGERLADHPAMRLEPPSDRQLGLAAMFFTLHHARGLARAESLVNWRSGGPIWSTLAIECDERAAEVHVSAEGRGEQGQRFSLRIQDDPAKLPGEPLVLEVPTGALDHGFEVVIVDGVRMRCRHLVAGDLLWLDDGGGARPYHDVTHRPAQTTEGAGSGRLTAPLDGAVTTVFVTPGQAVTKGQVLLVLEAMKMEHRIVADVDGTVSALHVAPGVQARTRQLLVELAAEEGES